MIIGCIAWGSLVWDPRELPVQGKWFRDGPLLPVEFARQSSDGRLTLVLVPASTTLRCLWAPLSVGSIDEAAEALRKREGVPESNWKRHIGVWPSKDSSDSEMSAISAWAKAVRLDAVVWTALPPRFEGRDERVPSVNEAVDYLRNLRSEVRCRAERYIRRAPRQVDTPYRRRFETEFDWTPLEAG